MEINKSAFHHRGLSQSSQDGSEQRQRSSNLGKLSSSSFDGTKNVISSSIKKNRGKLTRMLSVDVEGSESLHQQQLNLQHQYQQKMLKNMNTTKEQQQRVCSFESTVQPPETTSATSQIKPTQSFRSSKSNNSSGKLQLQSHNQSLSIGSPSGFEQSTSRSPTFYSSRSASISSPTATSPRFSSSSVTYSFLHPKHNTLHTQQPSFQLSHPQANRTRCRSRRNLSAEGWMKVQTFQQTHSASSTSSLSQKSLRFSADGLRRTPTVHLSASQTHSRSASCLPLSRYRGHSYTTSRDESSPYHLTRPSSGEIQTHSSRSSFDRSSQSPKKSFDKGESSPHEQQTNCPKHKNVDRKCEKCSLNNSESQGSSSGTKPSSPTEPSSSVQQSQSDSRSRRSQFRRAISLFSLSCDKETERTKEKSGSQQKILRPPTRHVYKKGLSGLPIEYNSRTMTTAY